MTSKRRLVAALASLALSLAAPPFVALAQPCDGQGSALLSLVSPLPPAPGRRLTFDLVGAPTRPFAIAADVGPGPVLRPGVGTICLDLGPRLRLLYDGFKTGTPALGSDGRFSFSLTLPPRADVGGRTLHFQAFVRDPAAPNGIAITPRLDVGVDTAWVEDFSTTARRDAAATTAVWGGGIVAGVTRATRTVAVSPADSGFNLVDPLRTEGSRFQMLFDAERIGAERGESIMGMSWGPRSNFVFASSYARTSVLLGHARFSPGGLTLSYDSNFDGAPTRVFEGTYATANRTDATWFPWPQFTTDFEYDGVRDLVFEVNVPAGATTYQLFRANWTSRVPLRRLIGSPGAAVGLPGGDALYHTRFSLARVRSVAQSTWFDTGLPDPDYREPVVRVASLPAGTEVVADYDGAEDDDLDGAPDPGTETGFSSDVDALDGKRLVRFRLRLKGNLGSGAVPRVTAVSIPFR